LSTQLANLLMCFVAGRWHQFAKSGFTRQPGVDAEILLARLLEALPA
jgi:TetR/AcrR family transcriptional regulator